MSYRSVIKRALKKAYKKITVRVKQELIRALRKEFYRSLDKLVKDRSYVNITEKAVEEIKEAFEEGLDKI